ncbi:hypothetical protein Hanom_Chr03g00270001 [Helianthus anomalus]
MLWNRGSHKPPPGDAQEEDTGLSEIGTYRGPKIKSTIPFHRRVHLCDRHQRLQKLLH